MVDTLKETKEKLAEVIEDARKRYDEADPEHDGKQMWRALGYALERASKMYRSYDGSYDRLRLLCSAIEDALGLLCVYDATHGPEDAGRAMARKSIESLRERG